MNTAATLHCQQTTLDQNNAAWDTLDDIEKRGVPEHVALLLAQNGPKPTRKKKVRKFLPTYEKLGEQKQNCSIA